MHGRAHATPGSGESEFANVYQTIPALPQNEATENNFRYLHTPEPRDSFLTTDYFSTMDATVPKVIATYSELPLRDLGLMARKGLARHLDRDMPVASNWEHLAELYQYSYSEIKSLAKGGKTMALLEEISHREPPETVERLLWILNRIERPDAAKQLMSDIEEKRRLKQELNARFPIQAQPYCVPTRPIQSPAISSSSTQERPVTRPQADENTISHGSDVYLLFNLQDSPFVDEELKPKLNSAGISYFDARGSGHLGSMFADEHLTAMKACRKVVIVLSDSLFGNDPQDTWLRNAVHNLDPGGFEKKIIPVIYQRITSNLNIFGPMNALDMNKMFTAEDFWRNLISACKPTKSIQ